jgi:hypothetical protein
MAKRKQLYAGAKGRYRTTTFSIGFAPVTDKPLKTAHKALWSATPG